MSDERKTKENPCQALGEISAQSGSRAAGHTHSKAQACRSNSSVSNWRSVGELVASFLPTRVLPLHNSKREGLANTRGCANVRSLPKGVPPFYSHTSGPKTVPMSPGAKPEGDAGRGVVVLLNDASRHHGQHRNSHHINDLFQRAHLDPDLRTQRELAWLAKNPPEAQQRTNHIITALLALLAVGAFVAVNELYAPKVVGELRLLNATSEAVDWRSL